MSVDNSSITLGYVEFYAGIGGWTMALEEACQKINDPQYQMFTGSKHNVHPFLKTECLAAFDHSEVCIDVWEHNFSQKKTKKDLSLKSNKSLKRLKNGQSPSLSLSSDKIKNKDKPIEIQRISQAQLEIYNAHIWVMSPPCQPHTRQHENQESEFNDPRSQSFLHLCSMISVMAKDKLPSLIFLENVVGFEKSKSFKVWRESLLDRGYTVSHFHLTPYQVGLPNDRPRYYCTATLNNNKFDAAKSKTTENSNNLIYDRLVSSLSLETNSDDSRTKMVSSEVPIINTSIPALGVKEGCDVDFDKLSLISKFLDQNNDSDPALKIPSKLLKKNAAWCFDILTPLDNRSSCFTHGYGRYVRGTGSILYIGKPTAIVLPTKKRDFPNFDIGDETEITNVKNNDYVKETEISTSDENKSLPKMVQDKGTSKEINEVALMDRFKLVSPKERAFNSNWSKGLDLENDFRYFSGIEMARLMGFPVDRGDEDTSQFSFPNNCTIRNQWRLIGNSLNSRVASKIVETGLLLLLLANDGM